MRLLLVSNSTGPDGGYLAWCEKAIVDFASDARRLMFIPFAGIDERSYGETAVARLGSMGFDAKWFDRSSSDASALTAADIVFVGGGNTFLLLDRLIETGLHDAIRDAARAGLPYIGTSAGSNVAGPTIKTTNDMPIVQPPTFTAMALVPFQINPHYVDPDPASSHQGETREQRLVEFLALDETPVVALREGTLLEVRDEQVILRGVPGARVYRAGAAPIEAAAGTRIDLLPGMPRRTQPDAGGDP